MKKKVMAKKRILIVSQHFWPETFRIDDIANFLVEKDCEIDVLCGIPNYPKGKFFEGYSFFKNKVQDHKSIHIERVSDIPRGNNSNFRIFISYISFPIVSIFHIPRLLTRKYDKIFIYQTSPVMMSIAGIILGKLKRTETTMYVLDLWPENLFSVLNIRMSLVRRLATVVSLWHYKHVDKMIALSKIMLVRLEEVSKISDKNIIIMPQVCEKIYEKDVVDKNLTRRFNKGFNIVYTGNISPAQSFDTVILAAKTLKEEGISDINWIIVGDGMNRRWLEEEVNKSGLNEYFYFEGMVSMDEVPKYNTIADALIGCLVRSDLLEATIPSKVMSYIAAGRPMILAMDGEVQTLINDKIKCGFAGPTGDAKILSENIKKVYDLTENDRKIMGKRGRDYHFKHFERNKNLQKLYNFIFS